MRLLAPLNRAVPLLLLLSMTVLGCAVDVVSPGLGPLVYGPTHREVQHDFSGWPRDSTRYEIHANVLVLEFYTYPADAPVLTRQTLTRVW